MILTDTVGFLRDLPDDLVAAFRATLEELHQAQVLVVVLDVADPEHEQKLAAVERLLSELGLSEAPRVLALNKCDRLERAQAASLARQLGGVSVSAARREGLEALLLAIHSALEAPETVAPRASDVAVAI